MAFCLLIWKHLICCGCHLIHFSSQKLYFPFPEAPFWWLFFISSPFLFSFMNMFECICIKCLNVPFCLFYHLCQFLVIDYGSYFLFCISDILWLDARQHEFHTVCADYFYIPTNIFKLHSGMRRSYFEALWSFWVLFYNFLKRWTQSQAQS